MFIKEFLEKQIKRLEDRSTAIDKLVEKATDKDEIVTLSNERSSVEATLSEFKQMLANIQSDDPEKQERANVNVTKIMEATMNPSATAQRQLRDKMAFALNVLKRAGMKPVESDAELRAVGLAYTDSAITYKAPAEGTDGDNNAGIFITEEIVLDLLNEVALNSPLFAAVKRMAVAGMVKFPYKKSRGTAQYVTEKQYATPMTFEWAMLDMSRGEIAARVLLTFGIRRMALIDLYAYLREQMADAMREEIIPAVLYGTGTNELHGILGQTSTDMAANVESATAGTITMEDLEAAYKKLPKKDRIGAVVYVASNVYDNLSFARDKNGRWMYVRENGELVKLAGKCPIVEDPYLNDNDVVIGNITKNVILNSESPIEYGEDITYATRIIDMNTWGMFASTVVPGHLVYLKAKAGE